MAKKLHTPKESNNPNFQSSQLCVANTYSYLMLMAQHYHVTTALCVTKAYFMFMRNQYYFLCTAHFHLSTYKVNNTG